ncbi:ATP-binding protein [Dehalococcoidia bacterium]|nr:ATP-binding protein [Dehalococcoidia bacterium]MCL0089793.1 ATP-binding protein [Dehalococcoidia bacterium]
MIAATIRPFAEPEMWREQALSDASRLKESLPELPEPVAKPFLIVLSGLPGTGKSYISRKLAERLPCVILSSDTMRRTLFPSPVFNAGENQRLFAAMHILIEDLLRKNVAILLDATNLVERHRERLYCIIDRLRLKIIILRVEAPPEVVQERLQARMAMDNTSPDSSDADFGVYLRMKTNKQRIRRQHFAVDTSKDIAPVIEKIVRELRR